MLRQGDKESWKACDKESWKACKLESVLHMLESVLRSCPFLWPREGSLGCAQVRTSAQGVSLSKYLGIIYLSYLPTCLGT